MTATLFQPDALPLTLDADGAVRVGSSRVLLEVVVHAYEQGETPDGIVRRFPSVEPADVYAVVAHYLRHRPAVDAYLAERRRQGDELRAAAERRRGGQQDLRAQLLARRGG